MVGTSDLTSHAAPGRPPLAGTLVPVSLGRRTLAHLLDLALLSALLGCSWLIARAFPGFGALPDGWAVIATAAVPALLMLLVFTTVLACTGYSPAGRALRVRQVPVRGTPRPGPPGWAVVAKYLLVAVLSLPTLGLGYLILIMLIPRDPLRQGWHDRMAGILVVDARPRRCEPAARERVEATGDPELPSTPGVVPARFTAPVVDPTGDKPARRPSWRVRFDDGLMVSIDPEVLVGRNPAPNAHFPRARLVAVQDDGRTLSKSHLAVGVSADGEAWVEDLHSTNGTRLVSDDVEVSLAPAVRTSIASGGAVRAGDRLLWIEAS